MPSLVTVVETSAFANDARGLLTEDEKDELKLYLAGNPDAGVVIPGANGVRKLRWAASGRGKRGGARVIYYFHDMTMPLYLFNFFTKAAKSDLTSQEKKVLAKVVGEIVLEHKRRK